MRSIVLFVALVVSTNATAQTLRAPGGTMRTSLGFGINLNDKSTLQREWIVVTSPSLPADFTKAEGLRVVYEDRNYVWKGLFNIEVKQPVSAIEIRFLVFDIWGERQETLTMTEVEDLKPGTKTFNGTWRILRESAASQFYASIGYVARVKLADGKVVVADTRPVIEEAKRFSSKFTESDLEQKK